MKYFIVFKTFEFRYTHELNISECTRAQNASGNIFLDKTINFGKEFLFISDKKFFAKVWLKDKILNRDGKKWNERLTLFLAENQNFHSATHNPLHDERNPSAIPFPAVFIIAAHVNFLYNNVHLNLQKIDPKKKTSTLLGNGEAKTSCIFLKNVDIKKNKTNPQPLLSSSFLK